MKIIFLSGVFYVLSRIFCTQCMITIIPLINAHF